MSHLKGLELLTKPLIRPVTRVELKDHLRIDQDDESEDDFLDTIIRAATDYFENGSWRQLITATYIQYLDRFPARTLELRKPPLQSVTSIKYFDVDEVEQTLDASVYEVDTKSEPGRVALAQSQSFPSTNDQLNAVKIEYIAGYGDERADVPDLTRSTIKLIAAFFFENRDLVRVTNSVSEIKIPTALDMLVVQDSVRSFV